MAKRRETPPAFSPGFDARAAMPLDAFEKAVGDVDLDTMLEQISGRLGTGANSAFLADQAAMREQVAALAADFLADPHYSPLVEWLLDITLRRPVVLSGMGDGRLEYADRREGANSVVWQLLQAAAEGRGDVPPAREGQ